MYTMLDLMWASCISTSRYGGVANDGASAQGGSPKFMQFWTIFYWGWWIAWCPFVGTFIARISKGRTIRQIFNYSLTAPLIYIIMWFAVFGGAGIKMHNTAMECHHQAHLGFTAVAPANGNYTAAHKSVTGIAGKGGSDGVNYNNKMCCVSDKRDGMPRVCPRIAMCCSRANACVSARGTHPLISLHASR